MRLPTNIRPNPNQALANRQWRKVVRSQYITANQGLRPRSIVGHPAQVAKAALFSQDVPYGDDPTRVGEMGTAWKAAMEARASETSQTLQLNGLGDAVFGRKSGTLNRALRVRRMPVGALDSLGNDKAACEAAFPPDVLIAALAYKAGLELGAQQGTIQVTKADMDSAITTMFGASLEQCMAVMYPQLSSDVKQYLVNRCMAGQATNDTSGCVSKLHAGANYYSDWTLGQAAVIGGFDAAQEDRFVTAAKRMHAKQWWGDNWEFYWKYLSGYTEWYKNPVLLAGGGVGALVLYNIVK